jgi:zinc ribbon protein
MRFACQSCGKAYNLPEERIAEKSNVKLKCRVCGAIVEVKRQGDVVAQILTEGEGKRVGRVSEAPTPLASMNPDDGDDATAAIAFTDHILSEHALSDPIGHAPPVPNASSSYGSSYLSGAAAGASSAPAPSYGGSLMPPPLTQSPLTFSRFDTGPGSPPPPMPSSGGSVSPPPPPLRTPPMQPAEHVHNGNNGMGSHVVADALRFPEDPGAPFSEPALALTAVSVPGTRDDTTRKMLAAFATGMLIGFIIAKLFF